MAAADEADGLNSAGLEAGLVDAAEATDETGADDAEAAAVLATTDPLLAAGADAPHPATIRGEAQDG